MGNNPASTHDIGTMPVNIVLSPDGQYAVITSSGFVEQLTCIRIRDGLEVGKLEFARSRNDPTNGLYRGLLFGRGGQLYAAQGAAGKIAVVDLHADGSLSMQRLIVMKADDFPAGLAEDGHSRLYVTNNDPGANRSHPLGTPGSVAVVEAASGNELGRYTFENDLGLSNFPLAVTVNADGSRLFVGSQRDDAVYVLDASNPSAIKELARLSTGAHPIALLMNADNSRLYVANAHSDTISVVDMQSLKIVSTVLLRPQIARGLAGATPTGLALSHDGRTLYATLGDMNAVAVVNVSPAQDATLRGYIPAGWYPTALAVAGNQLLVVNGKGDTARVPHDFSQGTSVSSPLYLFQGALWRVAIPDQASLQSLTQACLSNARLTPQYLAGVNPLQSLSRKSGPIQHVIYIIKENRTYDQVLGDLPQGNGDSARCLFPREVTPNLHALAERFILLDNFYDSGEVSGEGWTWSTQAQANEYTVQNVPYNYSSRGRNYDFEGTNNNYPVGGFPAAGPDGKLLSDDPRFAAGAPPVNDVAASPGGHLWDLAQKNGLTFRNYGCFYTQGVSNGADVVIPDNYPDSPGVQPGGRDLQGISDIDFRRFDLDFPDSDGPSRLASQTGNSASLWATHSYGKSELPSRVAEWKREFNLMFAKDPTGGTVPALMTLRLGTDHTLGASAGKPTPRCMVADNDYAVGELVDAVSRSSIWKSCVIVVVEDDAQNGPDHVDAHRSTCYIVSPWIKRGTVDHSFQNTVSAIRTMESLLNLPAMCQYDAASGVIGGWDSQPGNSEPYTAIRPSAAILQERSVRTPSTRTTTQSAAELRSLADLAQVSAAMDFSRADHAPADMLNQVIWKSVKGVDSEMPPTPHAIGPDAPDTAPSADDDDD